jgi:type VI secretion system secreted protein VgrG
VPDFSQQNSPLQVFTPLPENTLLATRLVGSEKLGGIFEFKVSLVAQRGTTIDFSKLMGQHAHVSLQLPGGVTRYFHGVILAFAQEDGEEVFDHYTMTLKPSLARLSLTKRSRIFQNQSAAEVWQILLDQVGVSKMIQLLKPLPKRVIITQYRETDLQFLRRLCSESGVTFYYVHRSGNPSLVLTDNTPINSPSLGPIHYHRQTGGTLEETSIRSWRLRQCQSITSAQVLGSQFEVFNQELQSTTSGPAVTVSVLHLFK